MIGNWDHNVYCLDLKDGHKVWERPTDNYLYGAATVGDDVLVQPSCDAMLRWLDRQSGDVRHKLTTDGFIASPPALVDGKLYFGNYKHTFYCVDAASGNIDWTFELPGNVDAAAAVGGGKVVFAATDHRLRCLDYFGRKLWEFAAATRSCPRR